MVSWTVVVKRATGVVAAVVVALGMSYLLLVLLYELLSSRAIVDLGGKERVDADIATKQLVVVALGGLFAAVGVIFTARTFISNKRGQVTERFIKAVGLLSSSELDQRLGGIYSLQQVMKESKQDHQAALEVLAACVREYSERRLKEFCEDARIHPDRRSSDGERKMQSAADIKAAVAVIARRPRREEDVVVDLSDARLYYVDMYRGLFEDARFVAVDLSFCTFVEANLKRALFAHSAVGTSDFSEANLYGSHLIETNFASCTFVGTNFEGSVLQKVDFRYSSLSGIRADNAQFHDINFQIMRIERELSTWKGAKFSGADTRIPEDLANYFVQSGAILDGIVQIILRDQTEVSAATWLKSRSATSE